MANRKKEVYKPKPMTEGKRNLIQGLLQEYDIQSAEDIQDALKDLLSGTIQDMLETEMDDHLGYDRYERSGEPNYRNGMKSKTVRSKYGEFQVDVPQDRQSSFEPQILPKRQKDISSIDDKIISMYAKGMTTRQISETILRMNGPIKKCKHTNWKKRKKSMKTTELSMKSLRKHIRLTSNRKWPDQHNHVLARLF